MPEQPRTLEDLLDQQRAVLELGDCDAALELLDKMEQAIDETNAWAWLQTNAPEDYPQLLRKLEAASKGLAQSGRTELRQLRQFVQVLKLHQEYPAREIEQAVTQALEYGCPHVDGVRLCLWHLQHPEEPLNPVDLTQYPELESVAQQPPDLRKHQQLLLGGG